MAVVSSNALLREFQAGFFPPIIEFFEASRLQKRAVGLVESMDDLQALLLQAFQIFRLLSSEHGSIHYRGKLNHRPNVCLVDLEQVLLREAASL